MKALTTEIFVDFQYNQVRDYPLIIKSEFSQSVTKGWWEIGSAEGINSIFVMTHQSSIQKYYWSYLSFYKPIEISI